MSCYYCAGCNRFQDDDLNPMDENELCEECQPPEGWTFKYINMGKHMKWETVHDNYDGAPDANHPHDRVYHAGTIEELHDEIEEAESEANPNV